MASPIQSMAQRLQIYKQIKLGVLLSSVWRHQSRAWRIDNRYITKYLKSGMLLSSAWRHQSATWRNNKNI